MFGLKRKKSEFQGKAIYTIDDYLEKEARTTENYEFSDGFVEKLNEPVFFIESISKFEKTLSDKLADSNFQVFSNFIWKRKKVWIEAENSLMYPSLFVVGSEINYYPGREDIIANPFLIIEVSTVYSMGNIDGKRGDQKYLSDRTNRFWKYQKIPSLKEYVLITDIGSIVIETYNKLDGESWKYQVFSNYLFRSNLVSFESIDVKLLIADFYL
jgi:hypothetical protein